MKQLRMSFFFFFSVLSLLLNGTLSDDVPKTNDDDDTIIITKKNPFAAGCLGTPRRRVCNSHDDTTTDRRSSYCYDTDSNDEEHKHVYDEVRIAGQDWEGATVQAWIFQIVLSELLGVPASIETGDPNKTLNFYDPQGRLEYGVSYDWDGLRRAYERGGDCRPRPRRGAENESSSCYHVLPEVWYGQFPTEVLLKDGIIEKQQGTGALGENGWFVPRFVGERDPTLLSFLGLAGEKNRRKLAETFLRPTKWKDYCQLISSDNCASGDNVTVRAPLNDVEGSRYFVEGLYRGHFRPTEKNDCDKNNKTCTGHFVDYPCGWSSWFRAQTHHLEIALESDGDEPGARGYTYTEMTEIVAAANETKSNVAFTWWAPEALYQQFMGTQSEFVRVYMPRPTVECLNHRVNLEDRCSEDPEKVLGSPIGVCDDPSQLLHRIVSSSLYTMTYDPDIHEALRSPAYDMISSFTMSEMQIGQILDYWLDLKVTTGDSNDNYALRAATCQWVKENIELIESMMPESHPRVFRDDGGYFQEPTYYAALILSMFAASLVLLSMLLTYRNRKKRVIVFAQIEFLWLVLAGLFLVACGAVVLVIPPSNASCSIVIWLVNIGFTLELVPLLVKVAAINRLMNAARQMRRVVLKRQNLFGAVFAVNLLVAVYMMLWTVVDPPLRDSEYELTEEKTEEGETVVSTTYYCRSESEVWRFVAAGWITILLICAMVLAFQTRKVRSNFNESSVLAILIYSHSVCLVLRLVLFALNLDVKTVPRALSVIYSVDVSATCFIYFFPKFFYTEDKRLQALRWMSLRTLGHSPEETNVQSTMPQRRGGFVSNGATTDQREPKPFSAIPETSAEDDIQSSNIEESE